MEQNRRFITNDKTGKRFLVVHEGLQNHPDVRGTIEFLARDLLKTALNKNNHLANIGLRLASIANSINETSKECFRLHEIEKRSTEPGLKS